MGGCTLGGEAGDAVDGFDAPLGGLDLDGVASNGEDLSDTGEVEVVVELGGDPDGAPFATAVLGLRPLVDELWRAPGDGLIESEADTRTREGSPALPATPCQTGRKLRAQVRPGSDQDFEASSRLEMDAGYGFGLPGNRGVLTPYAGLALGEAGDRTVRAGTRWQLGPDVVVGLVATRQASDASEPANELMLRAALRF